jgi:hypothetical protein
LSVAARRAKAEGLIRHFRNRQDEWAILCHLPIIVDTVGVRKVRWGSAGVGKRGGSRVIYFYHHPDRPLYLLMVYAKSRQENLSPEEKRTVRKLAAILKGA